MKNGFDRPLRPPSPLGPHFKLWCTGEDSNLRSSGERQIYSLLPLTTRPPVHLRLSARSRAFLPPTNLLRCRASSLLFRASRWINTRDFRRRANILPHQTSFHAMESVSVEMLR